jgi:hypothetical protein
MIDLEGAAMVAANQRLAQERFWSLATLLAVAGIVAIPTIFLFGVTVGSAVLAAYLLVWLGSIGMWRRAAWNLREIEEYAMDSDDPRAAALLFDSLQLARGRHRRRIVGALVRLLPRMRCTDAGFLTWSQRSAMRFALLHEESAELSLAILQAYEQIGDRAARAIVRMLAEGLLTHTRDPRIQVAARECMPALEARIQAVALECGPAGDSLEELQRPPLGAAQALALSLLPPDRGRK